MNNVPLNKTTLSDGAYKVINGIAVPFKEKQSFWQFCVRVTVVLFGIYLVAATTNCVVQEGVKIHDAIVTVA